MYSSLYTWRVQQNTLASPLTVFNFTELSNYVKRFATEGPGQPTAVIRGGWFSYQIDAITGTPTPLVVHLWFVRPRTIKLQSSLNTYLTATDVATDIDAALDGSDPLLNLQQYQLVAYRKHCLGLTTTGVNSTLNQKTKFGAVRLRMPKFVKNENASQTWTQVTRSEVKWTDQMYLIAYIEVASAMTGTPVQFSFNTTLKILQAF